MNRDNQHDNQTAQIGLNASACADWLSKRLSEHNISHAWNVKKTPFFTAKSARSSIG